MNEWLEATLGEALVEVDVRNRANAVHRVLSVTEGRGIIPQTEVYRKRIANEDTSNYKILQPLDIAWNPYLLWTGAVGQWLGDEPGVTSPVYPVFRSRAGQDARFWGLVLSSGQLTPYFDGRAIGSIQRRRRTTIPVFNEAPVLIPPLHAQARIVEVIGAIDDQIAALDSEAKELSNVVSSMIDDIASDVVNTRPLSALTVAIGSGPSWAATDEKDFPSSGALPVIKITNTKPDGTFDPRPMAYVSGLSERTRVLGSHSLVMIRTNGNRRRIGNVYIPPISVHGAAVSAFQFIVDAIDTDARDWLYIVLRSPRIQGQMSDAASGSTGLGNLAVRWLKSLDVPWPDSAVRSRSVETVTGVEAVLTSVRREAEHLRAARSSLLTALLNRDLEIDAAEEAVA